MIDDKDVKTLIDRLMKMTDSFEDMAEEAETDKRKWYFQGKVDGIRLAISWIINKNQTMKGFSSAVYGKKVAKEAKKNPKKAGKKMEKAFRNML